MEMWGEAAGCNIPEVNGRENYKSGKIGHKCCSLQRGGVGQGLRRDHWLVHLGSHSENHFTRSLTEKANKGVRGVRDESVINGGNTKVCVQGRSS